ncbi:MAG TPA: hypothetical protein VFT95_01100 [Micromonosporaceae bacterium]|nr:hypothetical protein [Micromonosporaceae bacterium]
MLTRPDADLFGRLASAPGLYRGRGDGPETGPFLGRMRVTPIVRGRALALDYEITTDSDGVRHLEHTVLVNGADGGLELHVTCLDLPGVTRFVETDQPGRFRAYEGALPARIVLAAPQPGRISYAWWWARGESAPREQSRCELRHSA